MARPEWLFEFPARYEVIEHDRVPDGFGTTRVFGYPDAIQKYGERQLSTGPIFEIRPAEGEPWIGLFEGKSDGWGAATLARRT